MNGNELLKKLKALAKRRGVVFGIDKKHGKGSHARVRFGDHSTTLKDRKKEIGTGLLKAMLRQLDIDRLD